MSHEIAKLMSEGRYEHACNQALAELAELRAERDVALARAREAEAERDDYRAGASVEAKEADRARARASDLLAACEAAFVWVVLATVNKDLNTENAKADLLRMQVAIARAGGEPGRGIDEAARAAIAKAKREG